MQLKFYLLGMLTGPEEFVWRIVFHFFSKIQYGRKITYYSQELEPLHRFVPRKHLTLAICLLNVGVILTIHVIFYVVRLKIGDSMYLAAKSMWGGWRRKLCPSGKSSFIQEINSQRMVFHFFILLFRLLSY